MIDADCTDPKIWSQKVSDILEGFKVIGENIPSVACVPMSASESWLLADPESWTIMGLGDLSILPKKPEEIWGTKIDPDSNHPHSVFSKICAAAGKEDNRETRFDVMSTSNIKSIIGRCPVSFVHFYNCMHTFIEEISV